MPFNLAAPSLVRNGRPDGRKLEHSLQTCAAVYTAAFSFGQSEESIVAIHPFFVRLKDGLLSRANFRAQEGILIMNRQLPLAELRHLFRRSAAFRQVLLADVVSQFGDGGLLIAYPMVILERTHDLSLSGLGFSGEILSFALLQPIAGYWADRLPQKRVMMTAEAVRSGILGLVLVALAAGVPLLALLGLSIMLGAAGAFFVPARAAFVVRLLSGDERQSAIALEGTTAFLMRLISPPLMGALLAFVPAQVGIAVAMAASLAAVGLLSPGFVRPDPALAGAGEETEPPGAWREGFRIVLADAGLRSMLSLDVLLSAIGMAAYSSTVAFLQEDLGLPASQNGLLLATTGLAGAIGAQVAQGLDRVPEVMIGLLAAVSASYLMVPYAPTLPAMMVVWAVRGVAIGAFGVLVNQRIAREVPNEAMGRVNGAWILAACLASFLGAASTPVLLRSLGPARSFTLYGAILALSAGAMAAARGVERWVGRQGKFSPRRS